MALLKKGVKYETKLVMLFFVAWGFLYLDRQAISMLMPMIIEDIALNNTKIGQINMWQTIGFAISAPVFAILSDRLGHKKKNPVLGYTCHVNSRTDYYVCRVFQLFADCTDFARRQ
nr:hypothetical protein [Planococcus glaciei]